MHHAESSKKRKRKCRITAAAKGKQLCVCDNGYTLIPLCTGRHARPLICINRHARPLICINRHMFPLIRVRRHAPAFDFTARLLFKITSAVQHPLYKGLHKTLLYTKRPDLQGFCETCIFFHIFPYTRKTFQNQGFSTHCIMYKRFSKPFIHIFFSTHYS